MRLSARSGERVSAEFEDESAGCRGYDLHRAGCNHPGAKLGT